MKTGPGTNEYDATLPERLLKLLRLDKQYERAEGNYLYFREGEKIHQVTDFAGGYGSLMLGHNFPGLVSYARDLMEQSVPVHAQLSYRVKSAELSGLISEKIGQYTGKDYAVILTNTGAEAVEAALKHLYLSYSNKAEKVMDALIRSLNRLAMTYSTGLEIDPVFCSEGRPESYELFREHVIRMNQNILDHHRPVILAPEKAFHGKTLGALHVTWHCLMREQCMPPEMLQRNFFKADPGPFDDLVLSHSFAMFFPHQTPQGDVISKERRFNSVAGIILEPIMGEGGILILPDHLLRHIRKVADENEIPLVFDEIQCGMYRTGHFIESGGSGVAADYYLLGKSLGGGISKISALAVERSKYDERFGFIQTSTFAEDELSSAIAVKTIELLEQHSQNVSKVSSELFAGLNRLASEFPSVVSEIRGRGCMAGVTFRDFKESRSGLLQSLSRSPFFGYVLCGYLLNRHLVRIAPTLSDPLTLRIEPSLFISPSDIHRLTEALSHLCRILDYEDVYSLVEYSLEAPYQKLREPSRFTRERLHAPEPPCCPRVGFLTHYIDAGTIRTIEPSMAMLPDQVLENWLWDLLPVSEPVFLNRQIIEDSHGEKVEIIFIGLGFTSSMARSASRTKNLYLFTDLIEKAVDMLADRFSVRLTGLGQFTSILTFNGHMMKHRSMKFTTGNSYTVSIGINSVIREIEVLRRMGKPVRAAIIGSAGNIASVCARCLIGHVDELALLGSDSESGYCKAQEGARELLQHLVYNTLSLDPDELGPLEKKISSSHFFQEVKRLGTMPEQEALWEMYQEEFGPDLPVKVMDDISGIRDCNVVVVSTSHGSPFLKPSHFTSGTLIYDISVPTSCTPELISSTDDFRIIFGGIVGLPRGEQLEVDGMPLTKGYAYGCIAETVILGLEGWGGHFSYGPLSVDRIELIEQMALRHGFCQVMPKIVST